MQHGLDDVLFDHVAGNAETLGDLAVSKAVEAAHEKDLAAARWQLFDSFGDEMQTLARRGCGFKVGVAAGDRLGRGPVIDQAVSGSLARQAVPGGVRRHLEQVGTGIIHRAAWSEAQQTQKGLLRDIGGSLLAAQPPRQEPAQIRMVAKVEILEL